VARVVVDVMLKPEILDPQGQAIANALPNLGFAGITAVRQGKRFEVEISGDLTEDTLAEVIRAAGTLLSNPVIEDFTVHVEDADLDDGRPGAPLVGSLPKPGQAAGEQPPQPAPERSPESRAAAEKAAQQGDTPPAGPTADRAAQPKPGKVPAAKSPEGSA
jgi:phosphoribosylformylglycinamidine synthase subunit PurS